MRDTGPVVLWFLLPPPFSPFTPPYLPPSLPAPLSRMVRACICYTISLLNLHQQQHVLALDGASLPSIEVVLLKMAYFVQETQNGKSLMIAVGTNIAYLVREWQNLQNYIWAASWQNQQNAMCAQRRLTSLIRVFTVCMKKAWVLSFPLSTQRRLWSDWADAQSDLSLRWVHGPFCWFCQLIRTQGRLRSTCTSVECWLAKDT